MNDKRIKIYQITKDKLENQLIYTLFIFAIPFLALLGYLNDKEDIVNAFNANKELICTSKDIKVNLLKNDNWLYEESYFIKDDSKILFSKCKIKE
jgi:hypothetical protein